MNRHARIPLSLGRRADQLLRHRPCGTRTHEHRLSRISYAHAHPRLALASDHAERRHLHIENEDGCVVRAALVLVRPVRIQEASDVNL